jgi:small redox-active disulfide protein 2
MRIEVLGTGCPKCAGTEKNVKKALRELNLQAEVVKVTDIGALVEKGVMSTPALVIDGRVVMQGKLPSVEQIKTLLSGKE